MGHVDGGVKVLFHIVLHSCLNPYFQVGPFPFQSLAFGQITILKCCGNIDFSRGNYYKSVSS
jgi:hypothetical protein